METGSATLERAWQFLEKVSIQLANDAQLGAWEFIPQKGKRSFTQTPVCERSGKLCFLCCFGIFIYNHPNVETSVMSSAGKQSREAGWGTKTAASNSCRAAIERASPGYTQHFG